MIIYGINACMIALEKNQIIRVYITKQLQDKLTFKHNNLVIVDNNKLDKLTQKGIHQGIACEIKINFFIDQTSFNKNLATNKINKILILDHIQDQQNLGAIIRSSLAFDFEYIILPNKRCAQINGTTIKASVGCIFDVKILQVSNITTFIKKIKNNSFWIVGGVLSDDALNLNTLNFDFNTCLVVGNEENGISRIVQKELDYKVIIPMSKKANSLNVSVSAAIMMYQVNSNLEKI